jgi:WD40 repeat protein
MQKGHISRWAAMGVTLLLIGAMGLGPATQPATPTDAEPLPTGAIRRLGETRFLLDGQVHGTVALSPDGRHAAVADGGGASIWDVATGARTAVVRSDDAAAHPTDQGGFAVAYVSADTLAIAQGGRFIGGLNGRSTISAVSIVLADANTGAVRKRVDLIGSEQTESGPMFGSPNQVPELAVSQDGTRAAFPAGRRSVLLYDLTTGKQVADLGPPPPADDAPRRPARPVTPGAAPPPAVGHRPLFSGDGHRLVVTSAEGLATVYDAATGRPIDEHRYPADRSASLSAEGRLLATVTADGVVHLFDLTDGHEVDLPADVRGTPPATRPAVVARPGRRPAAFPARAERAGGIDVTFAPTGGRLAVSRVETSAPTTMPAWMGNVPPPVSRQPRLVVVDTAARPPRDLFSRDRPPVGLTTPTWSADGRVVACGVVPRGLWALDAGTGQPLSPLLQAEQVGDVAVSPDGRRVALVFHTGALRLLDVDTNGVVADRAAVPLSHWQGVTGNLRFTRAAADGRLVLASPWLPAGLLQLDPDTLADRRSLGQTAFDPTGRRPAVGGGGLPPVFSWDGRWSAEMDRESVALVDPATDKMTSSFTYVGPDGRPVDEAAGEPQGLMFSVDGRRLIVRTTKGLQVADVPAGRFGRPVPMDGPFSYNRFTVSPDGAWLATKQGQRLAVFATDALMAGQAEPAWTAEQSRYGSSSAAPVFSDDSSWVAVDMPISGSRMPPAWGTAVFESATGRHVLDLPTGMFASIRFPAGRPIAVSTEQTGTLLVWDLRAAIAATGPAPAVTESDASLWDDLAADDPAAALRAGFALLDRGHLRRFVGGATPVTAKPAVAVMPTTAPDWSQLIADLSSPDRRKKEWAHRRLEEGGPAAAAAVRRALARHPGGETEARLADIARLQPDAAPPAAIPPEVAPPTADGAVKRTEVRRRRAGQLLAWSTPPSATRP